MACARVCSLQPGAGEHSAVQWSDLSNLKILSLEFYFALLWIDADADVLTVFDQVRTLMPLRKTKSHVKLQSCTLSGEANGCSVLK